MNEQRKVDKKNELKLLSLEEMQQFNDEGYLMFPEFFNEEWDQEMTQALEELQVINPDSKAIVPHPTFNKLLLDKAFLGIVRSLLGEEFLFHHANGRSLSPADTGKVWHHDYDGVGNWKPGEPLMIHLLVYPEGVDANKGALAILPKSHLREVQRSEPNAHVLGSLEGEIEVSGKPGLLVVLNSALWHSRRLNSTSVRRPYFNFSFCQFGSERPERKEYGHMLQAIKEALNGQLDDSVSMMLQSDTLKRR